MRSHLAIRVSFAVSTALSLLCADLSIAQRGGGGSGGGGGGGSRGGGGGGGSRGGGAPSGGGGFRGGAPSGGFRGGAPSGGSSGSPSFRGGSPANAGGSRPGPPAGGSVRGPGRGPGGFAGNPGNGNWNNGNYHHGPSNNWNNGYRGYYGRPGWGGYGGSWAGWGYPYGWGLGFGWGLSLGLGGPVGWGSPYVGSLYTASVPVGYYSDYGYTVPAYVSNSGQPVYAQSGDGQPSTSQSSSLVYRMSDDPIPPENGATSGSAEAQRYFSEATSAFKQGDYRNAMRLAAHSGVEDSKNAKPHELASLASFAQADYRTAAIQAHGALALAAPADWPTVYNYYGNDATYAGQLRALEKYSSENPAAADAQFLLGYHYLISDYKEQAKARFANALRLTPNDQLAEKILKQLGGTITAKPMPLPVEPGQSPASTATTKSPPSPKSPAQVVPLTPTPNAPAPAPKPRIANPPTTPPKPSLGPQSPMPPVVSDPSKG